jgi:hypothetical protein
MTDAHRPIRSLAHEPNPCVQDLINDLHGEPHGELDLPSSVVARCQRGLLTGVRTVDAATAKHRV